MKAARSVLLVAGLLTAFALAAGLVTARGGAADGSVLSRGSRGWLAARRYLEDRGTRVELIDEAIDGAERRQGLLVIVMPWQRAGLGEDLGALDRRLRAGKDVLVAYSGFGRREDDDRLFRALGLDWLEPRGRAPLHPLRWLRFANEEWWLRRGDGAKIHVRAVERLPRAPDGATVILSTDDGTPAAFWYPRLHGRVVVVPADVLSNGRIGEAGNIGLLEDLRALADFWSFDEFHHGLIAPATATAVRSRRAFDFYLLHLAFLYVLVALAVVRRFGPAWTEPQVIAGSTASFLVGLGMIHQRLRHHRQAAVLLLDRARELDPDINIPNEETATNDSSLIDLARRVSRAQFHFRRKE